MSEMIILNQLGNDEVDRITPFLLDKAHVVVRRQLGKKTCIFEGNKIILESIPSGIFNPYIKNIITAEMIDPKAFLEELDGLRAKGILKYQLFISRSAHILLPYHFLLNENHDDMAISVGDFIKSDVFYACLTRVLPFKNKELEALGLEPLDLADIYSEYTIYAERLKSLVSDTTQLLNTEIENKANIIYEEVCPKQIPSIANATVLAVTSPYTRDDYFDCVVINKVKDIFGITSLALTSLDTLMDANELKICIAHDGEPKIITLPGFTEDITEIKEYNNLPFNAKAYLEKIIELTNLNISLISVGPDSSQTIMMNDLFQK